MYLSEEARPGPSQAIKINFFVRIVKVFNIANYFCQMHHYGCSKDSDYTADLF